MIIAVLGILGLALAEDATDEANVDSGTKDLVTTIAGTSYTAEQSVTGTGFVNINANYGVVDPDETANFLDLKILRSGTGSYRHNSYIYVINNSIILENEGLESADHNITAIEDTSAVYAPMSLQFPGSFKTNTVKSLWKDQTYARNHAGMISMDSLFDYAKVLKKESTTTMFSNEHEYKELIEGENTTTFSSMDINSNFDGSAHLGVTLGDLRGGISGDVKTKADDTALMDEDYRGIFNLNKTMVVKMVKTTDYGDYDTNEDGFDNDYPWLPCGCNAGWEDMVIHDQRYHSAKGFFDCTTCLPPGPCKN